MLDRDVTIIPRTVTGKDARGNDVIGDGDPIEGLRALRQQIEATENKAQRDQQEEVFTYQIEPRLPETGEVVEIAGFDRIRDDGLLYEIRGTPKYAEQRHRSRIHHVEVTAYRIEG